MVEQHHRGEKSRRLNLLTDAVRAQELITQATLLVDHLSSNADEFAVSAVEKELADYSMLDVERVCQAAERAAVANPESFVTAYGALYTSIETLDRAVGQVQALREAGRIDDSTRGAAACDLIRASVADLRSAVRELDQSSAEIVTKAYVESLPLPERATGQAIAQSAGVDTTNIAEVAASQLAISNAYYENVLAQAKRSFNAAVATATLGSLFFLVAIVGSFLRTSSATSVVSTLSGAVVEVIAGLNFWLYSRTALQLDSFHLRLERMQRHLVANSISHSLRGKARDTALLDLIKTVTNEQSNISTSDAVIGMPESST